MYTRIRLPDTGSSRIALTRACLPAVVCLLLTAAGVATTSLSDHTTPDDPATSTGAAPLQRPASPAVMTLVSLRRPRRAAAAATATITLHRGDTLWALSRRCRTSVGELQKLNGLGHSTLIYAGHRLRAPATCRPVTATTRESGDGNAAARQTKTTAGRGAAAVLAYARAQLGKPYRYGAAGPAAFDCSGLTMRAWAAAGVHLPHRAADQAHAGIRTTRAALAPGDLVISHGYGHVQLYLGRGRVISAPHTGTTVHITGLPAPGLVDAYVHPTTHGG